MAVIKTRNKAGVVIYHLDPQPGGVIPKEETEAINLYQHVQERFKLGPLFFHVASEGVASLHRRNLLKQAGLQPGIADYILAMPRDKYHGMFLELKRVKKSASSISKEQSNFLLAVEKQGYFACICYGWKAAIEAIDEYMKS